MLAESEPQISKIAQFKEYLIGVRGELKKVVWPTRKDTSATTVVVLGMVILVSLFLWIVDSILALIIQWVIG